MFSRETWEQDKKYRYLTVCLHWPNIATDQDEPERQQIHLSAWSRKHGLFSYLQRYLNLKANEFVAIIDNNNASYHEKTLRSSRMFSQIPTTRIFNRHTHTKAKVGSLKWSEGIIHKFIRHVTCLVLVLVYLLVNTYDPQGLTYCLYMTRRKLR